MSTSSRGDADGIGSAWTSRRRPRRATVGYDLAADQITGAVLAEWLWGGGPATVEGTATTTTGGAAGTASGTRTVVATATITAGAANGTATGARVVSGTGTATTGGADGAASGARVVAGSAAVTAGGVSATATDGATTPVVDGGGGIGVGPMRRPPMPRKPRRPQVAPAWQIVGEANASLGPATASAVGLVTWSVLDDEDDLLLILA